MSEKTRFEPGLFFDGDDLSRLMIGDLAGGAEGAYHHSHWSVTFADGTAEELRQLASVHEGMHATLNDCTATARFRMSTLTCCATASRARTCGPDWPA